MVEALKKIDKKILIIAGVIILLPILLIIFLAIIQGCSNSKLTPEKYEKEMVEAAEKYFEDTDKLPTNEGEVVTVKLKKLVSEEYIKSTEKLLGDSSCSGEVSARRNGAIVEENEGGFVNYTVNLECDNYKTDSLINSLMNDLTTEGEGLYQEGNDYIFRGKDVDNYINFFGVSYRIVGIDESGLVKLIKSDSESTKKHWDIKYNVDTATSSGKNIYEDSMMLEYLMNYYNDDKKIDSNAREHIVANSVCVGVRDINNLSINENPECLQKLDNQVISLIGVTDYAKASLDPECLDITSRSCRNYNYMKDLFSENWTSVPVSSSSYEVYYINGGTVDYKMASKFSSYNVVIYIDGNEILDSGNGTEKSPYTIKLIFYNT